MGLEENVVFEFEVTWFGWVHTYSSRATLCVSLMAVCEKGGKIKPQKKKGLDQGTGKTDEERDICKEIREYLPARECLVHRQFPRMQTGQVEES